MPRAPEVLNTQETAVFLGVHVETVRRLARSGEIPSFKVGKDWRFGCRARQALNGADGLELVAQDAADLILLDLVMPHMNGPQLLEDRTHSTNSARRKDEFSSSEGDDQ